jgi:hypothetical protein
MLNQRPPLMVLTAALSFLAVAGVTWTLLPFTGIGVPHERHSQTPEPCGLVTPETVAGLVDDPAGTRSVRAGDSGWRAPVYQETHLRCEWGPDLERSSILVDVTRLVGAPFGLGPTGAEKANEVLGERCDPELAGGRAGVCVVDGTIGGQIWLRLRDGNVLVEISVDPGSGADVLAPPEPGTVERITEDVLSQLDSQ